MTVNSNSSPRTKTWTTQEELPELSNNTLWKRSRLISQDLQEMKAAGVRHYSSRCTRCNTRYDKSHNIFLRFHHRKTIQDLAADPNLDLNKANALSNLAVLCESCHVEWHAHYENKFDITFDEWKKLPSLYEMRIYYLEKKFNPIVKYASTGPKVALEPKRESLEGKDESIRVALGNIGKDIRKLLSVIKTKVASKFKLPTRRPTRTESRLKRGQLGSSGEPLNTSQFRINPADKQSMERNTPESNDWNASKSSWNY